jgi:hypothetical protein
MLANNWADVLTITSQQFFTNVILIVPNILAAVAIFIIGWLVGAGVGRVVRQAVDALRVDQALRVTGLERILSRAGFQLSAGRFLGFLIEWSFVIIFLVASLQVLGLTQVNEFLGSIVLGYLPRVIVASIILLVGAVVANASERLVSGSARAAKLSAAGLSGKVARYAVLIFTMLVALDQLQVAQVFVQTLFTGVVIALSLGIGLAFGLGGQHAASRYIEHLQSQIKE